MELPPQAQWAKPTPVLPSDFCRDAFHDSALSTTSKGNAVFAEELKPFAVVHESFVPLLGPNPTVRTLAKQDRSFAHEAGVYVAAADEVWFTSNLYTDAFCTTAKTVDISRVSLRDGSVSKVETSVVTGNGACAYQNQILFCDQGSMSRPSQLVLVNPSDSSSKVLLNNFHGRRFNSLNDVVVHRGWIWFTDPPYGREQGFRPPCQLPPQVYAFHPSSGDVLALADGFEHPNGLCFSPNGSTCYVTDTSHIHGSGTLTPSSPSTIYAFDVAWIDGIPSLRNRRLFAFADCGVPDGSEWSQEASVLRADQSQM